MMNNIDNNRKTFQVSFLQTDILELYIIILNSKTVTINRRIRKTILNGARSLL